MLKINATKKTILKCMPYAVCLWLNPKTKQNKKIKQQNQFGERRTKKVHACQPYQHIHITCKLDICADLEINFVHLATVAVAKAADVWLKMDLYWSTKTERIVWAIRRKRRKKLTNFHVFMSESETNMVKWISATDFMQAANFYFVFLFASGELMLLRQIITSIASRKAWHLIISFGLLEWTKRRKNVKCGVGIYFA